MREKLWEMGQADPKLVRELAQVLGVRPLLAELLVLRGISSHQEAEAYFCPSISGLHDPWLMKDMDKAVKRISRARENKEKVLIYGDYDVDGTTAVALVYDFLKTQTDLELGYYIPHRYREGYGLSRQGMEWARDQGYSLIITLDCGIKSMECIALAHSWGMEVIVCDHHTADQELPAAHAILNPKRPDCPYPYKELSGCAIGYKLIKALESAWELEPGAAESQLDLVATSVAADLVPLDGENRILAWYGLQKVNQDPNPGIHHLTRIAGIDRKLNLSDLVFIIGPRVNAAGRMDDAKKAVSLFITRDNTSLEELARALDTDNRERQELDRQISAEALAMIQEDETHGRKASTVLYKEDWHKGVVGIVASRLMDFHYRPTVVLCRSGDKVSGSCRSVKDFNIYEALHACRDLLDNYGGHYYAAGLTLAPENVEAFAQRFEEVVSEKLRPEQRNPRIRIDAEIDLRDIRKSFHQFLSRMEPFGPGNPRPVFLCRHLSDYQGMSRVIRDKHLKLVLRSRQGLTASGIGFGMAWAFPLLAQGEVDIVFHLEENHFQGQTSLQLRVLDIKPSGTQLIESG